jgi:hypothetical protein
VFFFFFYKSNNIINENITVAVWLGLAGGTH